MQTCDREDLAPVYLPMDIGEALTPAEIDAALRAYLLKKADYAYRGIDYGGLTSMGASPLVGPARVRFRDVATGAWIEGLSEPKIDPNMFRIDLNLKAYDPCPRKAHWGKACRCKKTLVGVREGPANLCTNVFGKFVLAGIFGVTQTITDTSAVGRTVDKGILAGAVTGSTIICAGIGITGATVADTNMQNQTDFVTAQAPSAISGAGITGSFTIAGTVTAASAQNYTECGIKITTTTNGWIFLICHDSFGALSVSASGTLAVTYTMTNT